MPSDYPKSAPFCCVDLPSQNPKQKNGELKWNPNKSSLKDVISCYQQEFSKYQDFFFVMDDFDKNCWVLEPEHPSRSSNTRRILLENYISLQLEIQVNDPHSVVQCNFLGPENEIIPLRDNLNNNIKSWDTKSTPRINLEKVLKISFLSRKEVDQEKLLEKGLECGICFNYKLENSLPDKVCENNKCRKSFHPYCLHNWLRSLTNSRQSFNTIFGECPYCQHPISLTI